MRAVMVAVFIVYFSVPDSLVAVEDEESDDASDIKEIIIEDVGGFDYGGAGLWNEGVEPKKRISFRGTHNQAIVKKKAPLFNKDFKLNMCKSGNCNEEEINKKTLSEVEECTFEGKLQDDPDSLVALTNCGDTIHLGVLSRKANLSSTAYHQRNGKVKKEKSKSKDTVKSVKDINEVYATKMGERLNKGEVFIGKNNSYYEVVLDKPDGEEETSGHDYAGGGGGSVCCFVKKTHCKVSFRHGLRSMKCTTKSSKRVCGSGNCSSLKQRVKQNAKKNIQNIEEKYRKRENEIKKVAPIKTSTTKSTTKASSTTKATTRASKTTKASTIGKVTTTKATSVIYSLDQSYSDVENEQDQDKVDENGDDEEDDNKYDDEEEDKDVNENNDEEGDDNEDEDEEDDDDEEEDEDEEYDDDYDESGEEKSPNDGYVKTKNLKDIVVDELRELAENTEDFELKGAPKEHKSQFRTGVVYICQEEPCRSKDPNPTDRVYDTRTIELGVFTDKYLWQTMQKQIGSSDEEEVKTKMLEMLHSLMVHTEKFFQHSSVTTKPEGGFNLVINGITIFQDDSDPLVAAIHQAKDQSVMLDKFKKFAKYTNDVYDGNRNSYDMMVLISGAQEHLGFGPGSNAGIAFVGSVCKTEPVLLGTISLHNGMHTGNAGSLIAHEMGHMMGANHDGADEPSCRANLHIMSPMVPTDAQEWSTCSRDAMDERRDDAEELEPNKGNCFYT